LGYRDFFHSQKASPFFFAKKISALILDLSYSFIFQIPPPHNTMRIVNVLYIRSRAFTYNLIRHVNLFSHLANYKGKIFEDRRIKLTG